MNALQPIYTEKRECQDCYKCVRKCPTKAIKVEAGCATVLHDLCVSCGRCVQVCPHGAKKVRDDLPRARHLVSSGRRVWVSLAPSFVSDFPGISPARMVAALRRLGFFAVSETALGAQEVSAGVARALADDPRLLLSTACPTVVEYVRKHRPLCAPYLTPLLSPLLTHCRMLRDRYGADIGIVFVGPCIAKKVEADSHPELLDVALTFEELRRWLQAEGIDPAVLPVREDDRFVPERATEGAWYAVDGGMVAGVKAGCGVHDASCMSFSGLGAVDRALVGLDELPPGEPIFLELLACEGGCVNGPQAAHNAATAVKRWRVLNYGRYPDTPVPRTPSVANACAWPVAAEGEPRWSESHVREALRAVGKFSAEDELNCGGCGYDSCREFGRALLEEKAERSMCVTYMRQLAQKKASALIHKMSSPVVIVNEALRVLEHNRAFRTMFADDDAVIEKTGLSAWLPFHGLFTQVLKSGVEVVERDVRWREIILHVSIFTIEKHAVVGAIIQDVTRPLVQKEQIINKAQDVIQRNLQTVQKIAYLLGENAAESEIMLSQIIDSLSPPRIEEASEGPRPAADGGLQDWRRLYKR